MKLVLFDFDGTLTRNDTLFSFLKFAKGDIRFIAGVLLFLPLFAGLALGFLDAGKVKARLLSFFLKGETRDQLETWGKAFCNGPLKKQLRPELMQKLKEYQQEGREIVIASASCDAWVMPFCNENRIICVCTGLAYDAANRFTGNFATGNCKGEEKKRRLLAAYDLSKYSHITAYGNSSDDLPMLELAHEKHMIR